MPLDATPSTCSCFPGCCRGGQVVDGRLANGQLCREAAAVDFVQVEFLSGESQPLQLHPADRRFCVVSSANGSQP